MGVKTEGDVYGNELSAPAEAATLLSAREVPHRGLYRYCGRGPRIPPLTAVQPGARRTPAYWAGSRERCERGGSQCGAHGRSRRIALVVGVPVCMQRRMRPALPAVCHHRKKKGKGAP